jgi:squalene-associated FAD-dependent desaturase
MHIAVIGAGWAGIAAAVELSHRGHQVSLFESARQAGGRARTVVHANEPVDNGQHLLIGAYQQTRLLLERIGVDESNVLARLPLQLLLHDLDGKVPIKLQAGNLPAPLHMLVALLTAQGYSWKERWLALRFCLALPRLTAASLPDCSVATLLLRHGQTPRLNITLWDPLCLAIMNTPLQQASAKVFIRVLRDAFLHRRADSDLLIPTRDLGKVIPEPAVNYIENNGGKVYLGSRVTALRVDDDAVTGLNLNDSRHVSADHYIIATTPYACQRLVAEHTAFAPLVDKLDRFSYAPICTVYVQYPAAVRHEPVMTGMLGSIGQWLFDRRICQQNGLMAVVISGHGVHEQMDNDQLSQCINKELATLHPEWPQPLTSYVVREKRATFVCDSASDHHRPMNSTALRNTWLAGDYTATGYPATLEGAIRSGLECVRTLLTQSGPA